MRILYYVPDLRLCNGVASYSMNYYRKLKEIGDYSIDFLLTDDIDTPYYDELLEKGAKLYFYPKTKNIFVINKFLDDLLESNKYDIVHCHVINRGGFVLNRAKKNGIKVRILHSHTTQNGDTFLKKLIRYPFKVFALNSATTYFACSRMAGNYLFGRRHYYVINNAIDNKFFQIHHRSKQEKLVVGTVGRFTIQKNPLFIVSIIEKLTQIYDHPFKFLWVGNGELLESVKNRVSELCLSEFVEFCELSACMEELYKKMDVFILPSLYEGLPVVGIEAQCMGLPCLFSDTISEEILINENTKRVAIDKPEKWALEILNYFRLESINDNKAQNIYDINKNIFKLVSIYEDLINNGY